MRFANFVSIYVAMMHGGIQSSSVSAFSPIRTKKQLVTVSKRKVDSSFQNSLRRTSSFQLPSSSSSVEEGTKKAQLLFYNSLTRTKDPFQPVCDLTESEGEEKVVKMYTCGPTVYDYAHVGNFRAFLTYDVLKRTLQYFGYEVMHICNLTDVDDKIIARCDRENVGLVELTRKFEQLFMNDLEALNIIKANKYPRATEHINEMVQMIQDLHANGLAYQSDEGSWYFAVDKKKGYGQQLVNLDISNMKQNASGMAGKQRAATNTDADEYDAEKEGVRDFALWKAYKPEFDRDDATWDTQIGKGRPGWHLECSAMAKKYLGDDKPIDIHCGGIDLKFPHHENEIAQSEGASSSGGPFCNCWIHNGFVNIGDEKMSKSKGNFLTLRNACPSSMEVRAYRYLVVSSQYRNPLSFTQAAMDASQKALKRMDTCLGKIKDALSDNDSSTSSQEEQSEMVSVVEKQLNNFEAALLDDLAMPRASASLFAIVKAAENEFKRVNKDKSARLDLAGLESVQNAILQIDQVFGIFYQVPSINEEEETDENDDDDIPQEVLELVQSRASAKEAKDWSLADELRDRITQLGYSVKDVKGGEPIISRVN